MQTRWPSFEGLNLFPVNMLDSGMEVGKAESNVQFKGYINDRRAREMHVDPLFQC